MQLHITHRKPWQMLTLQSLRRWNSKFAPHIPRWNKLPHQNLQFQPPRPLRNLLSKMFLPTYKEMESGAITSNSHGILLRGGFLRQSSSGIYTLLPYALRTLSKLEKIIDDEMNSIDAQKISLPTLLHSELWKVTGRWESSGNELFRIKDRKSAEFLLAPTHEEEITKLVAQSISSYRHLPLRLYQIGRKFRDEMRPRSGLLRGREFIMKDLYTFDSSEEEAARTYEAVKGAYEKIFSQIGVPFVVAEADTGNIGGTKSHEYHLISDAGEDTLLSCDACGYTANEERAKGIIVHGSTDTISIATPSSTDFIVQHLLSEKMTPKLPTSVCFSVIRDTSAETTELGVIVLDKQRTLNPLKLRDAIRAEGNETKDINVMDLEGFLAWLDTGRLKGSLPAWSRIHLFLDNSVELSPYLGSSLPTPLSDPWLAVLKPSPTATSTITYLGDYHNTQKGDLCPQCETNPLTSHRAIEMGHTFLLGTKYSAVLNAKFKPMNQDDPPQPLQMGCYGIGVSRLLAGIVEASHDERGIIWPASVAPYRVAIIPVDTNTPEILKAANTLYDQLDAIPWLRDEVVIDERAAGFGFRMKDAELVGYPWVLILGRRYNKEGVVELQERGVVEGGKWEIAGEDAGRVLTELWKASGFHV